MKNRVFVLLVGRSVRDGQVTTYLQLDQSWIASTTIRQILLFYQRSQRLYDFMPKKIEILEFVQGVNFEFSSKIR